GLLTDHDVTGANLGAGYRYFFPEINRIFGANAYFDNTDTGHSHFNQVGFGMESFGRYLDFRANGYAPVGERRHLVDDFFINPQFTNTTTVDTANPFFQGHNILFNQITTQTMRVDRVRNFEAAMKGFDLE